MADSAQSTEDDIGVEGSPEGFFDEFELDAQLPEEILDFLRAQALQIGPDLDSLVTR